MTQKIKLRSERYSPIKYTCQVYEGPLVTTRNEVGARLCFYTCLWFCSQGGLRQTSPRTRHPPAAPWEQTPSDQAPPQTRHTPVPWEQTPPDQAPPSQRSACWEMRTTSGRYASYWNAILYLVYCSSVKINLFVFFISRTSKQTKRIWMCRKGSLFEARTWSRSRTKSRRYLLCLVTGSRYSITLYLWHR